MSDIPQIAVTGAVGLMTTILASYASARLATRRAFQERWWERKEKTYTEIVDALHAIVTYYSDRIECELDPNAPEISNRTKENYRQAYTRIQKLTEVGPFVISDDAAKVLEELRDRPRLDMNQEPPWEVYEDDCKHYRKALNEIRACAKKDLRI